MPNPCAGAMTHWRSAEATASREAYQDHLARFSGCNFAALARTRGLPHCRNHLPDSDRRYRSVSELTGLSKDQLCIDRNARKGSFFRDQTLTGHFSRFRCSGRHLGTAAAEP
jgi:hypothetical protein